MTRSKRHVPTRPGRSAGERVIVNHVRRNRGAVSG